tara:strand:- start:219 stop:386 length:168 start_codon:yes stop_codon:yes gene_type:complete
MKNDHSSACDERSKLVTDLLPSMPGYVLVEDIFVRSGAVEPEAPELWLKQEVGQK